MTGFIYTIGLNVTGQGSVTSAVAATNNLDNSVNRVGRDVKGMGNASQAAGRQAKMSFDDAASSLKGWVVGLGIGMATLGSLQTAAQAEGLEAAISFASGKDGAKNIAFLNQTIKDLKLPIAESSQGFKTLLGSVMGTNITMEETQSLFTGIGMGAKVLRISAEDTNRAYLAVGQMASKGVVSMEELRGQLGDAIPGAAGIGARAMGMPIEQFNKLVESGKLLSEDFLPRFAEEMKRTFAAGVPDALNSASSKFTDFNNSVYELKKRFGEELLPTVTSFLQSYIIPAVSWVGQHAEGLLFLGSVVGGVWAAVKIWTAYQWLLNVALIANPIGLVVMAIGALIGAVVYAWNNFEGFRGFIMGMWEVIKEFGSIIYDFAIAPLLSLGKTLIGVLTFDQNMIVEGMTDGLKAAAKISERLSVGIGASIASAYNKGYSAELGAGSGGVASLQSFGSNGFFDPNKNIDNYYNERDDRQDAVTNAFKDDKGKNDKNNNKGGNKIIKGIEGIGNGSAKNITINAQFGAVTINSATDSEGADEVVRMWNRKLVQMLNSKNQTQ